MDLRHRVAICKDRNKPIREVRQFGIDLEIDETKPRTSGGCWSFSDDDGKSARSRWHHDNGRNYIKEPTACVLECASAAWMIAKTNPLRNR